MSSPNGAFMLSVSGTGALSLGKAGGKPSWSVGPFGLDGAPYALSLRPSGDLLLLANGGATAVWSSNSACKGAGGYNVQVSK
jgi:hypothetical protein